MERERMIKGTCVFDALPDVSMAIMDICVGNDTVVKVENIVAMQEGRDIVVRISNCLPCKTTKYMMDECTGLTFDVAERMKKLLR